MAKLVRRLLRVRRNYRDVVFEQDYVVPEDDESWYDRAMADSLVVTAHIDNLTYEIFRVKRPDGSDAV